MSVPRANCTLQVERAYGINRCRTLRRGCPRGLLAWQASAPRVNYSGRNGKSSGSPGPKTMCRNIKTLFNFDPPVTPDEVRAASLQFVRKITGFHKPSKTNETAFLSAIDEIAASATRLLASLETAAPARNREEEAAKAKARAAARFGD